MKIICSWCNTELGETGPPEEGTLEAICQDCRDKEFLHRFPCLFFPDDIICKRTECRGCRIFDKIWENIPDYTCAACGVNKDIYTELFYQKHTCFIGGKFADESL